MKPQNYFFLYKSSTEKKLSDNIKTNNSIINIDNDSFIANSHQSNFKKD